MIQRGRRRLAVRRIIQKCALCAGMSVFTCAIIIACIRFGAEIPCWVWGIAAVPLAGLLIWAWPWKFSDIEIARQIDASNQFGDRISSAMSFLKEEKRTEWMDVQIKDTAKKISDPALVDAFIKKAFQFEKPQHLKAFVCVAVASIFIGCLPDMVQAIQNKPEDTQPNVIVQTEVQTPNLDTVSQELRQDQVEKLLEAADELDDPELKEAAEELAQILKDDREGKLTKEEFERRLAALEKKIADSEPMTDDEQKSFDQAVKEAVESMTQMKEDPETKELAEALEKNDYDKAADILRDLLNSTDPEDKKKLEKLAKMFGDLAKNLDPTDPELKEALKKNKDLVDQLKKEFNGEKLSEEDKKAFSEAAKKLSDAEKEQKNLEQQKQQQQKANNQTGQALDKLSKAMDKTSKSLDDKAQEKSSQAQQKAGEEGKEGKEGEQKAGEQGKEGQEQQQKAGEQGKEGQEQQQKAGEQGKEGKEGEQKAGEQSKEGQEQQQDGQQGQQQKGQQGQQQEGQHGQQQDGQQQDSGESGQDGAQSAEDALREAADNKRAQQKRDELRELADKMRQDARQSGEEPDANAEERQKNMQNFMDRAKGQDKEDLQQQNDQQQGGNQDGSQNEGQMQDGDQGDQQGMKGQMQEGLEKADDGNGDVDQPNSNPTGKEPGVEPGKGHTTEEGEATSMEVGFKDEKLKGQDTGQTTSEIIESAGQKGFASEPYREVYQTYEKAAEEILESEEVPQGYRNYINKYFDMIRPL